MKKLIGSSIFIIFLPFFINAQALIDTAHLDAFMDSLHANGKFMGTVSVFLKGKEIYSRAVGLADVARNLKNNHDTKFRVGSISKTYTATLVMIAVEEGKLKLTDTLSNFYPQIKNAEKITIDMMLRHRSGIYNWTEAENSLYWEEEQHTPQEIIAYIAKGTPVFEPDEKYSYSNSNYALLSFILQKVYQASYNEILQLKNKQANQPGIYFGKQFP